MSPSTFTRAAIAIGLLASSVSAKFDGASKKNVAVYWGQGNSQIPLSQVCADPSVDIVNIGFVNKFPKYVGDYPGTNHANACYADYFPDPKGGDSQLLRTCPGVEQAIKDCQSAGKKVLLSLGGGYPVDYTLPSVEIAKWFAKFLIGAYGPVTSAWTAAGNPRPFGSAVLDGFDLDLEAAEWAVPSKDLLYLNYDNFGKYVKANSTMLLSGAPQCIVPDERISPALKAVPFDFLFIQFYNTPACSARQGYTDLKTGGKTQTTTAFTFDAWAKWLTTNSKNPNVKLYLGLPAGTAGAGADFASHYLSQEETNFLIGKYQSYANFGGVMLWEATVSVNNVKFCKPFGYWVKSALEGTFAKTYSSSACSVSSSAIVSSSTKASSSIASSTKVSSSIASSTKVSSSIKASSTLASSTKASSTLASSTKASSTLASSSIKASSSVASSSIKASSSSIKASSTVASSSTKAPVVTSSSIKAPIAASSSVKASSSVAASSIKASSSIASSTKAPIAASSSIKAPIAAPSSIKASSSVVSSSTKSSPSVASSSSKASSSINIVSRGDASAELPSPTAVPTIVYPDSYPTDASPSDSYPSVPSSAVPYPAYNISSGYDAYPTAYPVYSKATPEAATSTKGYPAETPYATESSKGNDAYPVEVTKKPEEYPSYPTGTPVVVTTTYVDVCSTGLTTVTTVITKTVCNKCAKPTKEAEYPEGWTTSVYVDKTITVTLTKPIYVPTYVPTTPSAGPPVYPADYPSAPKSSSPVYPVHYPSAPKPSSPVYEPAYPEKPSKPEHPAVPASSKAAEYPVYPVSSKAPTYPVQSGAPPKKPVEDVTSTIVKHVTLVKVPVASAPAPYPTGPAAYVPVGAAKDSVSAYVPKPTGTGKPTKPSSYTPAEFEGAASRFSVGLTTLVGVVAAFLVL